ncbi:MAG: SpoIID/LytB domain-containing protein [Oscillospiraceae bacterium]|nr:SpoIID/LytB domain-containing protein [Oscillospiraceae bacterium]
MELKIRQIAAALLAAAVCLGSVWAAPGEDVSAAGDISIGVTEQSPVVDDPSAAEGGGAARDRYVDKKIRVGLAYSGSTHGSLPEAKLLIADGYGSGYRFGFFDEELQFVELARTEARALSMVKTTNVYLVGEAFTEGISETYPTLGCYHLRRPEEFESFEVASAVAQLYEGSFIAWINGAYQVRVNSYTKNDQAQAAAAEFDDGSWSVCYTSVYGVNVVETGTTRILFQFDGGAEKHLGIMPGLEQGAELPTWFKGYKYYGGFRYQRISGGNITVVNIVPLDTYLKGVVPYESVKIWPLETLKAQALCAKNYALVNLNKHNGNGFDVCNTTDCQVYYGAGSGGMFPSELSDQAVDEVHGLYVWYNDKLAHTYFCSSNGGGTEDVSKVWGSNQATYPYLAGVEDIYEATVADVIPNYSYSKTWTKYQLTEFLQSKGYATGTTVEDFEVTEYSRTGNVLTMKFTYANGKSNTFSSTKSSWLRSKMGCRSLHFTVLGGGDMIPQECLVNGEQVLESLGGVYVLSGDGTLTQLGQNVPYAITGAGDIVAAGAQSTVPAGSFLISGTGWGHNIGYSQWGGYAMALQGFTCEEIIEFYFTGVEVGPEKLSDNFENI